MRSCPKLPLRLMEPMPDASDSPLGKAEPISDGVNAFRITELKKREILLC